MIARIWTTKCRESRAQEYQRFAGDVSLPMFTRQEGLCGVLFLRQGEDCRVLSLWEDMAAIGKLATSQSYQAVVEKIVALDLLHGGQTVELLEVHGGFVGPKVAGEVGR